MVVFEECKMDLAKEKLAEYYGWQLPSQNGSVSTTSEEDVSLDSEIAVKTVRESEAVFIKLLKTKEEEVSSLKNKLNSLQVKYENVSSELAELKNRDFQPDGVITKPTSESSAPQGNLHVRLCKLEQQLGIM